MPHPNHFLLRTQASTLPETSEQETRPAPQQTRSLGGNLWTFLSKMVASSTFSAAIEIRRLLLIDQKQQRELISRKQVNWAKTDPENKTKLIKKNPEQQQATEEKDWINFRYSYRYKWTEHKARPRWGRTTGRV